MGDILSAIATGYSQAGLLNPSRTPYKNVDPEAYKGTWSGTYSNTKKFAITVSNVQGFRAQVKYQSEGTLKYQNVLIKDNSFRVGDTKFTLGNNGSASIRTAVTDPVTNQVSLLKGTATRS
ncbi:MAG: hypothetical protein QM576_12550 [Rhodopseudomonas sp.]|uniref:hypothetical protein n=1 Tax=unclassified Rhodopseudomonas TaxID=2638247 RepID=UPI0013DFB2E5|nr:hypothetical protein [Rhodopseudomonas sp. BR0M22]MCD0423478.1 hypothetical protein [Rubrivivax sp. JA1024]NEW91612.1 hypothetical protein [Rhodopseudomonas sp. BR0M22]